MKKQDYSNHAKYYPPHHFLFYPLALLLLVMTGREFFNDPGNRWQWAALSAAVILLTWLSFMLRQHYALTIQDRLIRLELRFRYYVLTKQRLEPLEGRLSFSQLAAVRFASDEELPDLIKRALVEDLSPDDIKKAIRHWAPDHMRV